MTKTSRKIEITKRQLEPPFREEYLLTADNFIKFCERYGNRTSREELEYFEREALLLPAVRVYYGVNEFQRVLADIGGKGVGEWWYVFKRDLKKVLAEHKVKRVDEKTYYSYGALSMGRAGWLERYRKWGLVRFPSRQRFKHWAQYRIPETQYSLDPTIFENAAESFYSLLQIFPLRFIQERHSITLRNSDLYATEKEWGRLRESRAIPLTEVYNREFLRKKVSDYYRLFLLLEDLDDLWLRRRRKVQEMRVDLETFVKRELGPRKRLGKADIDRVIETVDEAMRPYARELRRKHGFPVNGLENWRLIFLPLGLFGKPREPRRLVEVCLSDVDDDVLEKTELPYGIVARLNWLIHMCGGRKATIRDLVLGWGGYRYCKYCGHPYRVSRRDRKTCGSPACEQAHSRALKREKRRRDKHKS